MRYFLCISTVLFVRILFLMEIRIEKELCGFVFVLDLENNIEFTKRALDKLCFIMFTFTS